jgi:hypothetical protein
MVYARVLNFPWFYYNRSLAMYYPTNYPSIKNSLVVARYYNRFFLNYYGRYTGNEVITRPYRC